MNHIVAIKWFRRDSIIRFKIWLEEEEKRSQFTIVYCWRLKPCALCYQWMVQRFSAHTAFVSITTIRYCFSGFQRTKPDNTQNFSLSGDYRTSRIYSNVRSNLKFYWTLIGFVSNHFCFGQLQCLNLNITSLNRDKWKKKTAKPEKNCWLNVSTTKQVNGIEFNRPSVALIFFLFSSTTKFCSNIFRFHFFFIRLLSTVDLGIFTRMLHISAK